MKSIILLLALIGSCLSAKGYATRYWDCCKPSCSWPDHAGDYKTRMCDKEGKNIISFEEDMWAKSACDPGGYATTCLTQQPWAVSETLAYGFAATPGGSNCCGKCYQLTFTGTGNWENSENNARLKGKKMIVMATNIGYDVAGGQFDVMIPGGGVGVFNGCASIFSGDMGEQYGGLLSVCEKEISADAGDKDGYQKRKDCLAKKCQQVFQGEALKGCMFHVEWLEAAGNPSLEYEEVPCPEELKAKY